MKNLQHASRRTFLAGLGLGFITLVFPHAAKAGRRHRRRCAGVRPAICHEIPDDLKPPEGQVVLLVANAAGVQIYECQSKAGKFEWTFKVPEADLFDHNGYKVGKHYRGPTWEANDGSKVVGKLLKSVPAADTGDIPWLLLQARSHEGRGTLSKVKYIQRVETRGGIAPAGGCDQAQTGQEIRMRYQATYVFYGDKPST